MLQSILKTLAYFDIFNTPLTKEEIFKWCWQEKITSYTAFLKILNSLAENNIISHKDGYYFLPDRENNIYSRQKTTPIVEKKMKIAIKAAKKINWIPFIEAVFVCNTVAGVGIKKESDIDFFIIVKRGRLWITRLLTTLTLSFFGLRRTKKNIANKICLSFYATDDALDLSKIKIDGDDIYLVYWIENLIPIYDPKNIQAKIKKENLWIKKYLPNSQINYDSLPRYKVIDKGLSKYIKLFFEKSWEKSLGDMVDAQAKGIQKTKMKLNFYSAQYKDSANVIISDSMLKFHENDRREYYQNLWQEKVKTIN